MGHTTSIASMFNLQSQQDFIHLADIYAPPTTSKHKNKNSKIIRQITIRTGQAAAYLRQKLLAIGKKDG